MDQVREMLREVFGTRNPCTLPMSGTGSAGMESCLVNLIEPGDRVLVGINGVFGTRLSALGQALAAQGFRPASDPLAAAAAVYAAAR